MTYTKTVWQDGDVITAQKMNNIENGIENVAGNESTAFIINESSESTGVLDKTWKEIHDAFLSGKLCILDTSFSNNGLEWIQNYPLSYIGYNPNLDNGTYSVVFGGESSSREYYASNENDYPSDR